jgi:hypothetical protein
MMEELGKLLRAQNIPFHSEDRQIMCFPHIINICCQHVISDFTNIELSESADDFFADLLPDRPHLQSFEEAIKRDPVALGRNIVRALWASGQRRDTFDETICDGNSKGWFKVKQLQLLQDVRTRWDSVYYMLKHLHELHPVRYFNLIHCCSSLRPIGIGHRTLLIVTNQL